MFGGLSSPNTSSLTQKRHSYIGNLKSKPDNKNTVLHCGDVLAALWSWSLNCIFALDHPNYLCHKQSMSTFKTPVFPSVCLLLSSSACLVCSHTYIYPSVHPFSHSFIHPSTRPFLRPFTHAFIHAFNHLVIHLSINPNIFNDTASCKAGLYSQLSFRMKHPDRLMSAAQHYKLQS